MFKVNNRNTRRRCEMCSKLTIKKHQNDITDVVMVYLLSLNIFNMHFIASIAKGNCRKFLKLPFISKNLPCGLAWNTFVMSGLRAPRCYLDML